MFNLGAINSQPVSWDTMAAELNSRAETSSYRNIFSQVHFEDSLIIESGTRIPENITNTDTTSYLLDGKRMVQAQANGHEVKWFLRNEAGSLIKELIIQKGTGINIVIVQVFSRNSSDSIVTIQGKHCEMVETCISEISNIHSVSFNQLESCLRCEDEINIVHFRDSNNLLEKVELRNGNTPTSKWLYKYDDDHRKIEHQVYQCHMGSISDSCGLVWLQKLQYSKNRKVQTDSISSSSIQVSTAETIFNDDLETKNFNTRIFQLGSLDLIDESSYTVHIKYDVQKRVVESINDSDGSRWTYSYRTIVKGEN
jgi:hypothetical protein